VIVSVVFLYPLFLGIRYWNETFVAGMAEMVEVMKNQDKRTVVCSVLFGYTSAKGVTSLTHFMRYVVCTTGEIASHFCEYITYTLVF